MINTSRAFAVLGLALTIAACGSDVDSERSSTSLQQLPLTTAEGSGQAHLAVGTDGGVVLSWLEPSDTDHLLQYSELIDRSWSPPRTLARSADWFINWADFPSVVPLSAETWAAHWLVLHDGFGPYDIVTARSVDSGSTWSSPAQLNIDGTETEHGFVTLFPWGDDLGAVWLDGRRLDQWTIEKELAAEIPLGVSLRYARMTTDGTVLEREQIDVLVCDCCQTDIAIADEGPVLTYRDRTDEEIRDIVVRRHDGRSWSDPVLLGPDNFQIDGCPVNGPAIAAADSDVVVAWFTAPDNQGRVRFARSTNSGRSFGAAVDVDVDGAFGQVDVVLLDDGVAVVSWWRRSEAGGLALTTRTVDRDGALGAMNVVAESDHTQPLDVPQMVYTGKGLVFAWTSYDADYNSQVKTAYSPL